MKPAPVSTQLHGETGLRRVIHGGFAIALAITLVMGLLSWRAAHRGIDESGWVSHTREVLQALESMRRKALDLQLDINGYSFGVVDSANAYEADRQRLRAHLDELRRLMAGDATQRARLDLLETEVGEVVTAADRLVEAHRTLGVTAGTREITDSMRRMGALDAALQSLREEQLRLLREREDRLLAAELSAQQAIGLAMLFATLLLALAWMVVSRGLRRDARTPVWLSAATTALDGRMAQRSFDLGGETDVRNATEESLRLSKERLEVALRSGGIGTWVLDIARLQVWWDDSTYELWGLKRLPGGEISLTQIEEHVFPSDRARFRTVIDRAVSEQGEYYNEFRIFRGDGEVRWIAARGRFLQDDSGRASHMVGASYDVTDRKIAEILTEAQNRALSMIATGAPLRETLNALLRAMETIDSETFCSILLLDAEGKQLRLVAAPSLPAACSQAIDGLAIGEAAGSCGAAAFTRESVVVSDIANDTRCARNRDVMLAHGLRACWSTPIFDASRNVVGTFAIYSRSTGEPRRQHRKVIEVATQAAAIAIDSSRAAQALSDANTSLKGEIAERTVAEEAMRVSTLRLFAAMDVAGVGTWVYDRDSGALTCDEALLRLLNGAAFDDPQKRRDPTDDQIHPEDRERYAAAQKAAGRDGKDFECEYRVFRHDGVLRWVRTRARRQYDDAGHLVRMIGATMDITETKEIEVLTSGQNRVLAMIAANAPLAESLNELLRAVEGIDREMLCSILLLSDDGVHVRTVAAPSLPAAFSDAIDGAPIGPRAGSCGTAMYRGEPVVVTDIEVDPLWDNYRALALPFGLRACWSTPIFDSTAQVAGAFAIYSREPRAPQARHERFITAVTQTASIAIENARAAGLLRQSNLDLEREVGERRAAEQALKSARQRLQSALEYADMGTWSFDVAGRRFLSDRATLKLFGIPPERDMSSMGSFLELVHPADRERVHEMLESASRGERDYQIEYRINRADGSMRWLAGKGVVQRDADGKPVFLLGACIDITGRKDAEELIAGQNRALAMIASGAPLEQTSNAIISMIEATDNSLRAAIWLVEPDGAHLRRIAAPSLPDALKHVREVIPLTDEGGTSAAAVLRRQPVITPDTLLDPRWEQARQQAREFELRACWSTPVFGSDESVLGALAFYSRVPGTPQPRQRQAIDIAVQTCAIAVESARAVQSVRDANTSLQHEVAERRVAEEALRESRERLQTTLQYGRMGTWEWDLVDGRGQLDATALAIMGRTPSQVNSDENPFANYIHNDDRERVRALVQAVLRGEAEYDIECRLQRADGTYCWIANRGRVERDAAGRPRKLLGVCWDVTERKTMEALVANQNRVLAMVAGGAPLAETLEVLAGMIEPLRDDLCATVTLFNAATGLLRVVAHHGPLDLGFELGAEMPAAIGYGMAAAAVVNRAEVAVEDSQTDPLWTHVREHAASFRLRSALATPIFDSAGNVVGAVTIISSVPNFPLQHYRRGVDIVAQTAAIAIESAHASQALRDSNMQLEREVQERRIAEEATRIAQLQRQSALEHAHMGSWSYDVDSRLLHLDASLLKVFGAENEVMELPLETHITEAIHRDDQARVRSDIETALRDRTPCSSEYRVFRRDRSIRWVAAKGLLECTEDGRPLRIVGITSDITERKDTEALIAGQNHVLAMIATGQPLRETLEALASIVESLGTSLRCVIWRLSSDGQSLKLAAWRGQAVRQAVSSWRGLVAPHGSETEVDMQAVPLKPGNGGSVEAVLRGEMVVVPDVTRAACCANILDVLRETDVSAMWAAPILDSSRKTIGVINIASPRQGAPQQRDLQALQISAQTAAIAIESSQASQALRDANVRLEREVDERRATEEALRTARAQLQTALEHARMGTWSYDIARSRLHMDEALLKVFGASGGDYGDVSIETHLGRWVHRDDQARVHAEIEAALRGSGDYESEYRLLRADHSIGWLSAKGLVERADDGSPLRIVGICSDITERKETEALIAGQNRVLAMIAGGAPLAETLDALARTIEAIGSDLCCGIWLIEPDGRQMTLSVWRGGTIPLDVRGPIRLPVEIGYGTSTAAAIRREPVVTADIETDPFCERIRERARVTGIRAAWSVPILDSAGVVMGTVSMASSKPSVPSERDLLAVDIIAKTAAIATESSRAAEALHEVNENLERKVSERTRDLVDANERLKELDRLKSQFLANMSHELRTPLNAIIGFTGTMLMRLPGPLTKDQENQLGIVRNSAQHLLSLINDILDLAKIESGKLMLRMESVVCQEVIADVAATLKPLADRKNLVLDTELPKTPVTIHADLRAVKQIVLNLANNAIKFTDKGGVRLGLSRVTREGRKYVEISVADTGIGIRPEDRERMFQAFSQLGGGAHDGAGIGLHLSQKFAQLIGGRIEFESEYGHGSRFAVLLPAE